MKYFLRKKEKRSAYLNNVVKNNSNFRYWNEKGLGSGRNAPVPDVDDTAMGFRLLRLNGYDVSPGN